MKILSRIVTSVCVTVFFFLTLTGCGPKEEQAQKKTDQYVYRIAFASFGPDEAADNAIQGYLDGLRSEGFEEGVNLEVQRKHAFGEIGQLPQLMQSLETEGLDLIVPMSTPGLAAAFGAIKKTPMVFVYTYDPLGAGAGKSYEDHLPNVTGVASFPPVEETMGIIMQLFPNAKKIGTIYNASESNSTKAVNFARTALKAKGLDLEEVTVGSTADVLMGTQALLAKGADVVWVTGDNTILQALEGVIKPVSDAHIPLILNDPEFVDRGALLGVGIGWHPSGFAAGKMAARVLRGENPSNIPIESIAKRRIVVNNALAEKMGIVIPPDFTKESAQANP